VAVACELAGGEVLGAVDTGADAEADAGADAGGVEPAAVDGAATVAEAAPAGAWTVAVAEAARLVLRMTRRPFFHVREPAGTAWSVAAAVLGSLTTLGASGMPVSLCRETVRTAAQTATTTAAETPANSVVPDSSRRSRSPRAPRRHGA
jgi:hypothetical protein